jgi:phage shock protein A
MTSSEPDPAPSSEPAPTTGPTVPDPVLPELGNPDYTDEGVPTFDFVRSRIEGRAATAEGRSELDAETPEGRSLAQQEADRDAAARDKLAEIRRSMGG